MAATGAVGLFCENIVLQMKHMSGCNASNDVHLCLFDGIQRVFYTTHKKSHGKIGMKKVLN